PPTLIDALSLHDALPIWSHAGDNPSPRVYLARNAPFGPRAVPAAARRRRRAPTAYTANPGPALSRRDVTMRTGATLAALLCALTDRKSTRLNSSHGSISY